MFSIKNQFRILNSNLDDAARAGWREAVAGCRCSHISSRRRPSLQAFPKHEDELVAPAPDGALRAARDVDVKHVVLTSSFAAIGYGHKPRITRARWQVISLPSLIRK